MQETFDSLPQQYAADGNKPDRVEDVGTTQQCPGWPSGHDEGEPDRNHGQLVREVMNAVHDQAEAAGLPAGDQFNAENAGIQNDCGTDRALMMRHRFSSWPSLHRLGLPAARSNRKYRRSRSRRNGRHAPHGKTRSQRPTPFPPKRVRGNTPWRKPTNAAPALLATCDDTPPCYKITSVGHPPAASGSKLVA